jgi:hypothetical protein
MTFTIMTVSISTFSTVIKKSTLSKMAFDAEWVEGHLFDPTKVQTTKVRMTFVRPKN